MFQGERVLQRVLLIAGLALIGGCGGGGGAPAPVGGGPASGGSGELRGTLNVGTSAGKAVAEAEPNDTLGQPDDLGAVLVGQRVILFGRVDASTDPLDGFRLRCPQRAVVAATLNFSNAAANDLALMVYDPTSLQPVEVFAVPTIVSQASFFCRGTFDLVVTALTGATDYRLDLVFQVAPTGLTEREPNDTPAQGQYTGVVYAGETLSLFGAAQGSDTSDVWLTPFPLAVTLDVELRYPAFSRVDLEVLDGTNDVASPTPLVTFDGSGPPPRLGSLPVTAGRLLVLRIRVVSGAGGSWQLHLSPKSPPGGSPKPGAGAGRRPAPLTRETERVPGLRAHYGRVDVPIVAGEVLVRCDDEPRGDASTAAAGGEEQARVPGGVRRVRVPLAEGLAGGEAARSTLGAALALEGAPGVRYAEPNGIARPLAVPNDPLYDLQWHYEQIHLPQAWEVTKGSSAVIVAVIDTGITPHPDLTARLTAGYDFISDPSNSLDGNGMDPDPTDTDPSSGYHGTHVAGTIGAATDNGTGVAGVTWAGRIMPLRVLGRWGGTHFDIAQSLRYAARLSNASGQLPLERAHVVNMSLGGGPPDQTLADACAAARNAGVVVVAAAGNESTGTVSYPAAHPGVVAVGALDAAGQRAPYSNWGSALDLMAPGGDMGQDLTGDGWGDGVLSTVWDDQSSPPRGSYEHYNGTSMAAPHVAGVAALVLAVAPGLTPAQVEAYLTSSANDLGAPGFDTQWGWGLVDAYRAVTAAQGVTSSPPQLHLDVQSVDFGATQVLRDLPITNFGTELLTVQPPVVTSPGGSWLAASLMGQSATSNATTLRLTVDRTGLDPGGYQGDVTLSSNGGSWAVHVTMVVVPALPPLPPLPLRIFLVSTATGQVERFIDVDANRESTWTIPSVPQGRYFLRAGTDLDHDGRYDDDGEYVGAWPSFDQPFFLDVEAGWVIIGLTLPIHANVSVETAATGRSR